MPWSAPLVGPGLAVDLKRPTDLSWRVCFDAPHSLAFGIPPARTRAFELGSFVGDVRRGGSCNCETHELTPHGDGTHTEGVGHLLPQRVSVVDTLKDALMPALLVTVQPQKLSEVDDEVSGNHAPDDRVVDQLSLEEAIQRAALHGRDPAGALVVRTQAAHAPHGARPAYFTVDAASCVAARGFSHLLVDLPSLDRADDGGLLGAHRAFFDLPARGQPVRGALSQHTITELCAIPAALPDGRYALALQLAPIEADAVPSRPLLYPLVEAPLRSRGAVPTAPKTQQMGRAKRPGSPR